MLHRICEVIKKFISGFKSTNENSNELSSGTLEDLQEEILKENQNTEFLPYTIGPKKEDKNV